MKRKTRNQRLKARAKKGAQKVREAYIAEVEKEKGQKLTQNQIKDLEKEYRNYKTSAQRKSFVKSMGQKLRSNVERKTSFSAGAAGNSFTQRFANVAKYAYEIVNSLSAYSGEEYIDDIISTANKLINYSTSDTYDYDTIKSENKSDINDLQHTIDQAKSYYSQASYEESLMYEDSEEQYVEYEDNSYSKIFDILDRLQSIMSELNSYTSDVRIPNNIGALSEGIF